MINEVLLFSYDYINVKSFRTQARKAKIREAYKQLFGEVIRISCSTCYIEALFKIINYSKNMIMATPNYELKKGVLLQAFGDASKTCTNDTLTDELAEWYLKNYPEKAIYFARMPHPVSRFVPPPAGIKIVPPPIPAGTVIVPPAQIEKEQPVGNLAADLIIKATGQPGETEKIKKPVKKPVKSKK